MMATYDFRAIWKELRQKMSRNMFSSSQSSTLHFLLGET